MKPTINENSVIDNPIVCDVCVSEYTIDNPKLIKVFLSFEGKDAFTGVVKDKYGTIAHYVDGKIHRDDGAAIEWADGFKEWYMHDVRHRKDGPAIEYSNGGKVWYFNGECYGLDDDFTNESWVAFLATLKFHIYSST